MKNGRTLSLDGRVATLWRQRAGFTSREAMAEACGQDIKTVTKIEQGKPVFASKAAKYCEALPGATLAMLQDVHEWDPWVDEKFEPILTAWDWITAWGKYDNVSAMAWEGDACARLLPTTGMSWIDACALAFKEWSAPFQTLHAYPDCANAKQAARIAVSKSARRFNVILLDCARIGIVVGVRHRLVTFTTQEGSGLTPITTAAIYGRAVKVRNEP